MSTNNDPKVALKTTVKDQSGAGKLRIGEILRKEGQVSSHQLEEALEIQKKTKRKLGSILLHLGYIDDKTIVNVLSRIHNFPAVYIAREPPTPETLAAMPYEIAKKYMAFPLRQSGKTFKITMSEPTDTAAVESLQTDLKQPLTVCVSSEKEIIESYKKYYNISEEEYDSFFDGEKIIEEEEVVGIDDFGTLASEAAEGYELDTSMDGEDGGDQYSASDAPIIKLVNGILIKAVTDGVSDIHIEPYEKSLQVRYRLDGSLYKSMNLPLTIKNALNSRIKIMANLDITERRVPQDGRIKIRLGRNRAVDFRVSTLPTLFGESTVLRILDKGSLNVDLTKLGFESKTFTMLKRCITRPQGLLLVTGPTGSGKTVTLYSILNSLNKEETKILTAEDPVEFNFKGINQVNVHQEIGMTFAAALKAFLRQDPDIIMVGEIRDMETAEIAIKAAMTGHLVLSTLHTNDCPATIGRLADIGIPSYMLASSVSMVLSQRLARRLCPKCKKIVENIDRDELISLGFQEEELEGLTIYGPKGCAHCKGGGYKGRIGFFELMEVTDEVAMAISAEVPEDQLRKVAILEGMTPLRRAGINKIIEGVTSVEEVLRRTVVNEESLPAYLVNPDVENYENGDYIVRQDNKDIDFFKLVNGALSVVRDGKKIAELTQPGDYFGEMSAISGEPRSASIVSKGRSTVKRFPGDKIMELIEKHPDVSKHLFQTAISRLGMANNMIVKLADELAKKP
ncbi:MAG: type IV-A pilus assembly ATPase PilB [Proteobacteria bacterium]|nr:type IV-A pilus assembly ATPase PilB [Pseudomonadota bacterium]MBU1714777.1 type IV-A pilus assembly ATPase PilB [Pseudomonadota bacterium]